MYYRHSLRFRIIVAFVISGAVLGPLMTLSLLYLSYSLEEHAVEITIGETLESLVADPARYPLQTTDAVPELRVFTRSDIDALPVPMLQLPDGVHEHEPREGAWLIALASVADGRRYAVIEDITLLERREHLGLIIVGVGTVLSIYVAMWLGYYLSRHLLAPLKDLSARVAADDDRAPPVRFAPDFAADEIGALAAALDRYRMRMGLALQREREFSADASHELRNPLAVIQNAAEIIEEDERTSERSRRAAQRIAGATVRMSETVTALLLMIKEPRADSDYEPVSVAKCVETTLQQQEPLAAAAGLRVHWQCDANPQVRAPRAAVESIVANLLRNAVQHSGGDNIWVSLKAERFVVVDDGVGIRAEELPRLVETGWRGSTAAAGGYGIGLSLVRRLCERFGWRLTLDRGPESGTRAEWRFAGEGAASDGEH